MNREEIKQIIPHREPMLLIDEAEVQGDTSVGRYTVQGDEWFLQGHFPGNPVVPGVMLCEMMAQSACALLAERTEPGMTPYFTSLDKVRFKKMVIPGDTIEFRCELTGQKGPFYFCKGKGTVAGKVCITGEFSFAVQG
ncbi:MAG: 3-hydroxyacyl-ACP dehydratase FabZ [Oscillospiraceae bacterium]|nr:3-hydroxyacyl-ACP dehydratase FabZ [Oscillospiraceae bacterium]